MLVSSSTQPTTYTRICCLDTASQAGSTSSHFCTADTNMCFVYYSSISYFPREYKYGIYHFPSFSHKRPALCHVLSLIPSIYVTHAYLSAAAAVTT